MTWLKEWDRCVFKRQAPKKRKMGDENADTFYHDALGRPRERVCAAPGLILPADSRSSSFLAHQDTERRH